MSAVTRPQVVHVRVASVEKKQNLFVQVTVKIHSKQVRKQLRKKISTVFCRFGSGTKMWLMQGLGQMLRRENECKTKAQTVAISASLRKPFQIHV